MTQTQEASVTSRTRTFSWTDPTEHVKLFAHRSGLEVLRAMAAGDVPPPPVFQLIGGNSMVVEPGSVVITLDPQEFHYNPIGTVHGGIISTLLDTAAACSVQSTLPAGTGYTSMDLNVKFLRPITVDTGIVTCTGAVLQQGRRTALAEARLTDSRGRLIAHATSSCLIFDLPTS
ncbi:PaaI family thioesterase [Actinoplanes regularis]|uniref:Uncharacterized domain 1-containing protein n=1 Tax=Actinoplanes regularis TaxID=52697 RepID=A0A239EHM7_9ACTN|nr:PaaI family thioesterase [Actinoplanes regularis]GIE89159.1 phenylacetic acid degradation protein [Actinoplanes regularis]GLW34821.1 phenylacetic acid degradation protein [Actinoplanes regularis]SNS43394.1 uncharacterized domain 1-containing protein [Actinoplanes regularis]